MYTRTLQRTTTKICQSKSIRLYPHPGTTPKVGKNPSNITDQLVKVSGRNQYTHRCDQIISTKFAESRIAAVNNHFNLQFRTITKKTVLNRQEAYAFVKQYVEYTTPNWWTKRNQSILTTCSIALCSCQKSIEHKVRTENIIITNQIIIHITFNIT